jgi:hypothetical protein
MHYNTTRHRELQEKAGMAVPKKFQTRVADRPDVTDTQLFYVTEFL